MAWGAAALIVLSACGTSNAQPPPSPTAVAQEVAEGPRTAEIAEHDVNPIVEDPAPELLVTVRSFDGVDVTVTDVSRIVTVYMYGTLTETVFSLCLGDNGVGRDSSFYFPSVAAFSIVSVG